MKNRTDRLRHERRLVFGSDLMRYRRAEALKFDDPTNLPNAAQEFQRKITAAGMNDLWI